MKRFFTILVAFFLTFTVNAQFNQDLLNMLPHLNADSIGKTIQDLENFGNRYCDYGNGNKDVAEYIVSRLQSYGIPTAHIDSFYLDTTFIWLPHIERYCYNAVGFIPGKENRDSIVIVGAHLDAISLSGKVLQEAAPGADDNASGVAVMLELARIINKFKLQPRNTIFFIGYDAEEVGFQGSRYDAQKRANNNDNVIAMLNNDMVSNQPDSLPYKLTLHWYDNATELADKAAFMCENFTTITPVIPAAGAENKTRQNSDSYMYALAGFEAVFAIEYNFSDYYHTVNDLYSYCNIDFAKEVAKMNFALLYDLAIGDIWDHSGINDHSEIISAQISPNPSSDQILIHCGEFNNGFNLDLYDISGRKIRSERTMDSNLTLNISSLESGIYIAEIQSGERKIIKKIIKK